MIKCRRRQATKPQKFKKIVNGRFLLVEAEVVEAEAIGVEAETEAEAFEK